MSTSDDEFAFTWPHDGDSFNPRSGTWYWSPEATQLSSSLGYYIDGTWAYAFGSNGSIDEEVWVEFPITWHFYGFEDDEVFHKETLVPILRPPGDTATISTQCEIEPHNSLSSTRFDFNHEAGTFPVWPEWDREDAPPPSFSEAVRSDRACGKFSYGKRSQTHRSVGVSVSLHDFCDPLYGPPPSSHFNLRALQDPSDDPFCMGDYDPYYDSCNDL